MKQKILKIIAFLGTSTLLLAIAFSTSSKGDGLDDFDGGDDNIPCDEEIMNNLEPAFLSINFDISETNPFRRAGFEGFIPSPDLRFGDLPTDDQGLSTNSYLCIVTLTSPQCSDWVWSEKLTNENTTSFGRMNVPLPPPQFDVTVKVEYSETAERNGGVDYNVSFGQFSNTSVVYTWEMTYLGGWNPDIPQPIFLKPSHQTANFCELGCTGIDGKNFQSTVDYGGLNSYLEANELFGH